MGGVSSSGFFGQRFAILDRVEGGNMGCKKEETQSSRKKRGQRRPTVDGALCSTPLAIASRGEVKRAKG